MKSNSKKLSLQIVIIFLLLCMYACSNGKVQSKTIDTLSNEEINKIHTEPKDLTFKNKLKLKVKCDSLSKYRTLYLSGELINENSDTAYYLTTQLDDVMCRSYFDETILETLPEIVPNYSYPIVGKVEPHKSKIFNFGFKLKNKKKYPKETNLKLIYWHLDKNYDLENQNLAIFSHYKDTLIFHSKLVLDCLH